MTERDPERVFVLTQRNPHVIGGLDILEEADDFASALLRADELDPHYRLGIHVWTLAEVERKRAFILGPSYKASS